MLSADDDSMPIGGSISAATPRPPMGPNAGPFAYPALQAAAAPSWSLDQIVANLTRYDAAWIDGTINYAFYQQLPSYDATTPEYAGFAAFTAAQQNAARIIFQTYAEIANVTFTEVADSQQYADRINFAQSSTMPDSSWGWTELGGPSTQINGRYPIGYAEVWTNSDYASGSFALGSYNYLGLMHEIGHALGLAHPGDYDASEGDPTYGADAEYQQDSLQYSIMSYFSASNTGARHGAYAATPLLHDIAAIQALYGANKSTRADATTYGFNSNAGAAYNFALNTRPVVAIWDGGGVDAIDLTGYSTNNRLSLEAGTFSDVGGWANNLAIAFGVTIERGYGGSGSDQIIGNSSANFLAGFAGADTLNGAGGSDSLSGGSGLDTLTGGSGADTFRDTAANLNGDTITDLSLGDRVIISDATLPGFSFAMSGSTLSYTGGSLTLQHLSTNLRLVSGTAAGGGVELYLTATSTPGAFNADFNDDGRSDLFWRNDNGWIASWLGQAGGGFIGDAAVGGTVAADWKTVGVGDFNGDGRSDLFWRNDGGWIASWLGQAGGGFLGDGAVSGTVSADWKVVGVGDFNGDGRSDLFWRNDSGEISGWLGQAGGGFVGAASVSGTVSLDWNVLAVGDFNGDSRSDILWRNDDSQTAVWLGQTGGAFTGPSTASPSMTTDWTVVGSGDFNGDGFSDLLWRKDNGEIASWLGQANGAFANNSGVSGVVPNDWKIVNVGDYNADGRADIFWRNDNGQLASWLGKVGGGFSSDTAVGGSVSAGWWTV